MTKIIRGAAARRNFPGGAVYSGDVEGAIGDVLKKLADVDRCYEHRRRAVNTWSGSPSHKRQLRQIEIDHQRHRESLVLELADLHYRMMRVTIFRGFATRVPSVPALRTFQKQQENGRPQTESLGSNPRPKALPSNRRQQ